MFQVALSETYKAKVSVDFPGDNGKSVTKAFFATFKRLPQSELDDLMERVKSGEMKDRELIHEVMVGWSNDVTDKQGNVLEFNETNLDSLLEMFPTRPTIVKTFFASTSGAKVKN